MDAYLRTIALRETPPRVLAWVGLDDLVQTVRQTLPANASKALARQALLNDIRNAIRNYDAQRRRQQRAARTAPKNYGRFSREPGPLFLAMFAEGAARLTAQQWRLLLLGDETMSPAAIRMATRRAERILQTAI